MFKRVRELVLKSTDDKQTPWEETSLKGEDFYFNIDVSITVETPGKGTSDSAATTQQETAFWNSIEDSTDPGEYESYLAEYPNGKFASLARIRLKKVQATQTSSIIPPAEATEIKKCQSEKTAQSINSEIPTQIHFLNNTGEVIKIFWLNYEGKRKFYNLSRHKEGYTQTTFVTHPWVVTDANEMCVGLYLPSRQQMQVVVHEAQREN